MEDSYNGNDEEFKQMNNQQEESIEEGENESEGEDGESQSNINLYNKEDFKLDKVIPIVNRVESKRMSLNKIKELAA